MNEPSASDVLGADSAPDLSVLSWCVDEIRQSLQNACEALQRQLAAGPDDASALRAARTAVHQAHGALAVVGVSGVPMLTSEAERLLGLIEAGTLALDPARVDSFSRACEAISEYLDDLLAGEPHQPLYLYPWYRDLALARGADRAQAADLFVVPARIADRGSDEARIAGGPHAPGPAAPERPTDPAALTAARGNFERGLLKLLRAPGDRDALQTMHAAVDTVLHSSRVTAVQAPFWRAAMACFEAWRDGALSLDVPGKRLLARINLQMRQTLAEGGPVADRLLAETLFVLAGAEGGSPLVRELRAAYRLDSAIPLDYETRRYGSVDANALAAGRAALVRAKHSWESSTTGAAAASERLQAAEALAAAVSSLPLRGLHGLCAGVLEVGRAVASPARESDEALALEAATALLFAEQMFDRGLRRVGDLDQRADEIGARLLQAARSPDPLPPMSDWMLEIGRSVQERATMVAFVAETRSTLHAVERAFDGFFRDPVQREGLQPALRQLQQVGGALRLLGHSQAGEAATDVASRMTALIQAPPVVSSDGEGVFLADLSIGQGAPQATDGDPFELVAARLGALGFFIDGLLTPGRAGIEVRFDPESGAFDAGIGLPATSRKTSTGTVSRLHPRADAPDSEFARVVDESGSPSEWGSESTRESESAPASTSDSTSQSAPESPSVGTIAAAMANRNATAAVAAPPSLDTTADVPPVSTSASTSIPPGQSVAAPSVPAGRVGADAVDSELLEIFLGEAAEVLEAIMEAVALLRSAPTDADALTAIRRGFHTLKGSGRMVGLVDFGAAAWSMEQVLNLWLAEGRTALPELQDLIELVAARFRNWVDLLGDDPETAVDPAPVSAAAQALLAGQPASEALAALIASDSCAGLELDDATRDEFVKEFAGVARAGDPSGAEEGLALGDSFDFSSVTAETPVQFEDAAALEAEAVTGLESEATASIEAEAFPAAEPASQRHEVHRAAGQLDEIDKFVDQADQADQVGQADRFDRAAHIDRIGPSLGSTEQAGEENPEQVEQRDASIESEPESELAAEALADEVIIGGVVLGRPLYEIFLNEADSLIGTLLDDAEAWAAMPARPATEIAQRAVHSLKGSASVVSLHAVQAMAEHLEVFLLRQRVSGRSIAPEDLADYSRVIERLQSMLHRFAAGHMPADEPASLTLAHQLAARWEIASGAYRRAPLLETGELDADLLPIFVEEASDILPQIGENLRLWQDRPADRTLQQLLMRQLHTVKGSARMAGAMDLGQRVHEMETRVEAANGLTVVPSALIDELIAEHDEVVGMFEIVRDPGLRAGDRAGQAARTELVGDVGIPGASNDSGAADSYSNETPASVEGDVDAAGGQPATGTERRADENIRAAAQATVSGSGEEASRLGRPAQAGEPVSAASSVPADARHSASAPALVRVRADLLDRLVNESGEVSIARSRLDNELSQLRQSLQDLTENVARLRGQLREIEIQAESQIQARNAQRRDSESQFDPLEFDRFTRFQELTRMLAESVNDVATVQHNAMRSLDGAAQDMVRQGQVLRELQQNLMRMRMVQFGSISDRLYRVVRQVAKQRGKRVSMDLRGASAEIDRGVLERISAPIEHLLRNAVAHGIEAPAARAAAGKVETGEIRLEVRQEGNEVVLVFSDDGSGLDRARIVEKARAGGLIPADQAVSEAEAAELIFLPGFSTADVIDEISGRGVGLDVVRSEVASLGGRIDIDSTPGAGTRFTVHLPLTLALAQVVLVTAGPLKYAIPSSSVEQVLQLKPQGLAQAYAAGSIDWQGSRVPMHYLATLVDARELKPVAQHLSPLVVIRSANQRMAVHVDTVSPTQEVVVKNVGPQVARVRGIGGATVLGNGEIVLIVNAVRLAQAVLGDAWLERSEASVQAAALAEVPPTVMVVDDSLTVRKVTQRLLVREGYDVMLAKDGVDALRQLQDRRPDVMLVDIEMPRMDGFDLTRNLRGDDRYREIPIVMITSRTADKHRNYAMSLGVDVYLGKPYRDDELLRHVSGFTRGRASRVG